MSSEPPYLLAVRAIAGADLDGREVVPEVAGTAHDEEALAVRGLDLGRRERARRGVVALLCLGSGGRVEGDETRVQGEGTGERAAQEQARHGRDEMHGIGTIASSRVCAIRSVELLELCVERDWVWRKRD